MPQQINLCTTVLVSDRKVFSARTMALAMGIFLVVGGAVAANWVWSLQRASTVLKQALTDQTKEIDGLKVAIAASLASAAPVDQTLVAQLQAEHVALGQREQLLFALQSGVLMPGWGHSDRLQLVARSIPDAVWVTEVRAESSRLQVIGFTLEPAALNEWVDKLSVSPLMRGLKLATVQVENTAATTAKRPAAVASEAGASAGRPMWSFDLVSAPPEPLPVVAGTGSATKGVKP